jgi:hypothetical protein
MMPTRMLLIQILALLALPLAAQTMERSDCEMVKLYHDGSYQVCGADRETLAACRKRIEGAEGLDGLAFAEALRLIACDAGRLDGNLRHVVEGELGEVAAGRAPDHEEVFVAIAESGLPALQAKTAFYMESSGLSAEGWERLARVAADRLIDTEMREILLSQLTDAGVNRSLVERIALDPSDPAQFLASEFFVTKLDDRELAAILADPTSPLFAAACSMAAGEDATRSAVLPALCRIALEHKASPEVRGSATRDIAYYAGTDDGGCLACAAKLLENGNLFETSGRSSSATVILSMMERELAAPLAREFDSTVIADPAQRDALDELRLRILADSPRSPDDHCFRGLCMW